MVRENDPMQSSKFLWQNTAWLTDISSLKPKPHYFGLLYNMFYNKLYNKSATNRSNGVWASQPLFDHVYRKLKYGGPAMAIIECNLPGYNLQLSRRNHLFDRPPYCHGWRHSPPASVIGYPDDDVWPSDRLIDWVHGSRALRLRPGCRRQEVKDVREMLLVTSYSDTGEIESKTERCCSSKSWISRTLSYRTNTNL